MDASSALLAAAETTRRRSLIHFDFSSGLVAATTRHRLLVKIVKLFDDDTGDEIIEVLSASST